MPDTTVVNEQSPENPALTLIAKPVAVTHWSCHTMEQQEGISRMVVHGHSQEHKLKPHQVKELKGERPLVPPNPIW
jgi:hypothetical protein